MALPQLYAIYDADGSLLGELSYLKDKCLGKAECALCDLSHGWNPLGKASWRQRRGQAASLEWVHRDEVPPHVLSAMSDHLPCIAMDREGKVEIVISKEALAGCEGRFEIFEHLLEQKLRALAIQPRPQDQSQVMA